jgi:hypothetical protein
MANELKTYLRKQTFNLTSVDSPEDTIQNDLQTYTLPANTIGAVGALYILAAGTCTGANDAKTITLEWGTTTIATVAEAAGAQDDWIIEAWVFNTATNAQRIVFKAFQAGAVEAGGYVTATEDTTASVVIKTTGDTDNATDEITSDVLMVQILQ